MLITGWKLKEAIKEHELRRDAAVEIFDGTLSKFDDEQKQTPQAVMDGIVHAERAIARLQTAQAAYNLSVQVELDGERVSLAEAVKRVGGYERRERMWRNAMRQVVPHRARSRARALGLGTVQVDEEAKMTMTQDQAREQTSQATRALNKLRAVIGTANGLELDIKDLDPSLFP